MKMGWYIVLVFLWFSFIFEASAFQLNINETLPNKLKEGELVNFTLHIFGFPKGYILSIDTDLVRYSNDHLFNIIMNNISKKINEKHVEINASKIDKLTIQIIGEVPNIKEVRKYDNIVTVKYKKATGYAYYRIKLIDEKGNILDADTKTFDVVVPERENFRAKLNKISDVWERNFLIELHDEKGLTNEANMLADHLMEKPKSVSLLWFVVSLITVAFIFFIIGRRGCIDNEQY